MILLKRYNKNTKHLEVVGEYYDWCTAISALNNKRFQLQMNGFTIVPDGRLRFDAYQCNTRFCYYLMPE